MLGVVRVKRGVKFTIIRPAGFRILAAIDTTAMMVGRDLEITCGTEGHAPTNPHTLGEAYDVGVRGLSVADIVRVKDVLRSALGPSFTVLYECPELPADGMLARIATVNELATAPHFHIQRKRGTVYPPESMRDADRGRSA